MITTNPMELRRKREIYQQQRGSAIGGSRLLADAFTDTRTLFDWNEGRMFSNRLRSALKASHYFAGAQKPPAIATTSTIAPYSKQSCLRPPEESTADKTTSTTAPEPVQDASSSSSVVQDASSSSPVVMDDMQDQCMVLEEEAKANDNDGSSVTVVSPLNYYPPQQDSFVMVKKLSGCDLFSQLFFTDDICFMCKEGGDLLLCDFPGCGRAFHSTCYNIKRMPEGQWTCRAHFCWKCEKTKKLGKPCIICAKNWCSDHRGQNRKIGRYVDDVCYPCQDLLRYDAGFLRFHLYSFHISLNNLMCLDLIFLPELRGGNLTKFIDLTDQVRDDQINNDEMWEVVAKNSSGFANVSPQWLKQLYVNLILPYKKFFMYPPSKIKKHQTSSSVVIHLPKLKATHSSPRSSFQSNQSEVDSFPNHLSQLTKTSAGPFASSEIQSSAPREVHPPPSQAITSGKKRAHEPYEPLDRIPKKPRRTLNPMNKENSKRSAKL
eukprot:TRINITY_DN616_c0_g1_i2.p1 TRINITY_DN616_c0_g1~~TRINITY_DN616_c0_g1_i2.p1  ORF type:complete len:490 (-),score=105.48 TRINITY_DN616_c0_g1_i2:1038-2507(-)